MTPTHSAKIFAALANAIPNPTTELHYNSNFELLIAVILSARTTDKIVNKITAKLFARANSPQSILALGLPNLKRLIKSSGFFNTKAVHIIETCKILNQKFAAQVPTNRQELESLPGVGRKTANVILNLAFKQPTIAVDTHVLRVARRIGIAQGNSPRKVETELLAVLPQKFAHIAGNLLLLHGRYTCSARRPVCQHCTINTLCAYYLKLGSKTFPSDFSSST